MSALRTALRDGLIITLCKAAELQTPGISGAFYRISLLREAVEQAAAGDGQ